MTKFQSTNTQISAWTAGQERLCSVLYIPDAGRGMLGLFGGRHHPGTPKLPMQVPQACAWRLPGQVAAALSWKQVCLFISTSHLNDLSCTPFGWFFVGHLRLACALCRKYCVHNCIVHAPRSIQIHGCAGRLTNYTVLCREEVACRFCSAVLPDWKPILTPPLDDAAAACPTMSVTFNGQVSLIPHPRQLLCADRSVSSHCDPRSVGLGLSTRGRLLAFCTQQTLPMRSTVRL